MVTTSCVLNAPRCVTTVPRVRLHGSRGGVFVDHRPPRDPGDPPHIYKYITSNGSFTSIQMCHTHTLPLAGWCDGKWGEGEDEGEVKVRWPWRWDEKYLTRTRRGERKRRKREHQHNTPGPERANPERARKKKSGGSTDTEQDQRRGGKDESAWTNQPDTARTYKHLSTRRSQPTWGGRNAWDRGPMGISWWNHKN